MLAVRPQKLTGGGIERHNRATRARSRVNHAVDHQRRAFEFELRAIAETVGLEAPGDLELAEVRGVDLIEGFVAVAAQIAAVGRPLAILGRSLAKESDAAADESQREFHPAHLFIRLFTLRRRVGIGSC